MRQWMILLIMATGFGPAMAQKSRSADAELYNRTLKKVTDIMVNDVTSPVAASRYYAYVTLAAFETLYVLDSSNMHSFGQQLNGFGGIAAARPGSGSRYATMAAQLTLLKAGQRLLPSGYMLQPALDSLTASFRQRTKNSQEVDEVMALADSVVKQVVKYAQADGFARLNNLPRYTPRQGAAYWQPTPPAFMAPVEPHWNTLRPFLLDSARQFRVKEPAPYDTAKQSSFFRQLQEVYAIGKEADPEKQAIAEFWDCNPFAVEQIGHVEFGIKKISPGGHWVGITGIACKKSGLDLRQTALAHVLVSITLADAFIACWDEKYRSNRVRPETAIQQLIDPRWRPLLQTPPFPEYVSGHSVASSAAAVVLTRLFGPSFRFADDTEVEFGLPVRTFQSFQQAAAEASISRLYGGIHYRDAIDEGIWQGTKVGEWAVKKLAMYFRK